LERLEDFLISGAEKMVEETQNKIIIVSAPSGTGKTTILQAALCRIPRLAFSISATTRPPRSNEVHGKHYYFLETAEFHQLRAQNAFIEWEEVYPGRFYGTLRMEVQRILAEGKTPIFEVDVFGGINLKKQFAERALAIFLQPPSLQALKERLIQRGTEDAVELEKRLRKAELELQQQNAFDAVVENLNLEQAIQEVVSHIEKFLQL
jgi:guanylate kinase